jgi:hypothetical protein
MDNLSAALKSCFAVVSVSKIPLWEKGNQERGRRHRGRDHMKLIKAFFCGAGVAYMVLVVPAFVLGFLQGHDPLGFADANEDLTFTTRLFAAYFFATICGMTVAPVTAALVGIAYIACGARRISLFRVNKWCVAGAGIGGLYGSFAIFLLPDWSAKTWPYLYSPTYADFVMSLFGSAGIGAVAAVWACGFVGNGKVSGAQQGTRS